MSHIIYNTYMCLKYDQVFGIWRYVFRLMTDAVRSEEQVRRVIDVIWLFVSIVAAVIATRFQGLLSSEGGRHDRRREGHWTLYRGCQRVCLITCPLRAHAAKFYRGIRGIVYIYIFFPYYLYEMYPAANVLACSVSHQVCGF